MVATAAPAVSMLILTEDSHPRAFQTIRLLAPKLLRLVHPDTATHRILFEPGKNTKGSTRANRWKSKNPQDHALRADLLQELATKVLEDDVPGYVLFHIDGDRPWSQHESSENVQKFDAFVQLLGPTVEGALKRRGLPAAEADVQARLRRICRVTPFYSIEAWLYQNTKRVRELCQQRCGKHLELIGGWERDRLLLDELERPKKLVCIQNDENHDLANSFTHQLAGELYLLGQSFHHTVELLQSCPGLQAVLRATWDGATGHGSSN
jgi:hypothetical protein